jgi:exopolyphosphatase / guanosine-5'-triphosphate,3'-diphosphate pyrophosphatase
VEDRDAGRRRPEAGFGDPVRFEAGVAAGEALDAAPPGASRRGGAAGAPSPKNRKRRKRRRKAFVRDDFLRDRQPARPAAKLAGAPDEPVRPAPRAPQQAARPPVVPSREPGGGRRPQPAFAALDLGTNNCRLLVAVPAAAGQFRVVDAFSRIVRLGEGLSQTGRLSGPAMDRAVEALKVCADKLGHRPMRRVRLIATEACRAATNGMAFLDRVERETGLALEVIDRHTEAQLAVSGCGSLVEETAEGVVLFDIGGGSTEIALVDLSAGRPARLADAIVAWTSLPVGVVSLAERFGGRTVTPASFAAMTAAVAGMIEGFAERGRLAHMMASPRFHLLGTSGTVTTLAGIHLRLDRYDRRRVDGLWMEGGDLDRIVETLVGWDFAARVANPCIGPDRADLVLAGCAILQAIRAVWAAKRLRVADRGLREGILSELMAEDGAWSQPPGGQTTGRAP